MATPPPPPPPPVGEDSWLDFIDQQRRSARSLEQVIHVVELYRSAVNAEPASIRVWIAYCEYFWALYVEAMQRSGTVAGWPPGEQAAASGIFSLDAALHLWSEGHEATKFRLSDSHELWNRWIALERELLDQTRTAEGVRRITHLYRNRLAVPHATWDDTSSAFSSFLSEYSPAAYEETMAAVTEQSRAARRIYELHDPLEMALRAAIRSGDEQAHRDAMARYLAWETAHVQQTAGDAEQAMALRVALGLFGRALTGIFMTDDLVWSDLIVFVSQLRSLINGSGSNSNSGGGAGGHKHGNGGGGADAAAPHEELARVLPNSLDILQRAVQHCPWSGSLWARYIICGEQAGLNFSDMERIKHAATNSSLDRDGMTAVVDMYAAWCGYLRRCAMDPNASDEAVDLADSGLVAALEAVQVWGERRFGNALQGDPNYRLERIMIYHLTEKHGAIEEAREHWEKLAQKELLAHDYSFWLSYYMWEMNLFQAQKGAGRSSTPATPAPRLPRTASRPANVLRRALQDPHLNWPERVADVYVKHCNDFESSDVLRRALDDVHVLQKTLTERRREAAALHAAAQAEAAEAAAAQAQAQAQAQEQAQAQAQVQAQATHATQAHRAPHTTGAEDEAAAGVKRKWEAQTADEAAAGSAAKRAKNENGVDEADKQQQQLKRDRENTSVFVTNLPLDVTATKVRQYFRDYGHVNNIQLETEEDGKAKVALVEFRSVEDVQSALIRDGKYFGSHTIGVRSAAGTTLYVTNFPPTADDAYIRGLFDEAAGGGSRIFGIRWPSLKYNAHRRFCYVSYRDAEAAARARQLDGRLLEGKYKLSVQYSNPTARKAREGAADEGREVHVKNLGLDVDEAAVEKLFARHGTVERVRLLRNMAGRSRGSAFVVMGSKEEAARAVVELDQAKLGSQILAVELSVARNFKPAARETSAPAADGAADGHAETTTTPTTTTTPAADAPGIRTFALLGIPDTVNIARVRALVEPHGHVVKLVLRADHGGAIVEFGDAAAAGKAQLALEGARLDETHRLRTGPVAQLFKEKAEVRVDRIDGSKPKPKPAAAKKAEATTATATATAPALVPPPLIRRPVLGSKGAKRGVGVSGLPVAPAKATAAAAPATNGTGTTTAGGGKKSNAEFRALFLSSGGAAADAAASPPQTAAGGDAATDAVNGHGAAAA